MGYNEIVFRVGGAAGDGVSSIAESFARICARHGLNVFTYSSYQSVIRGGHVWTQVRAAQENILSQGGNPNILVCLNQDTMDVHATDLMPEGLVLYDGEAVKTPSKHMLKNVRLSPMPLVALARKFSINPQMRNTVALGAVTRLLGMDFGVLQGVLEDIFGHKKEDILKANVEAARAGYDHAGSTQTNVESKIRYSRTPKLMMTGNEAICLGALAAGCKFLAQYPMTPASSILHWMAVHGPRRGVVVKQAEDELAAINMAIGAGHAGARAMVATSGGGFSLMVEALGEAGMTETPVVTVLVQRAGPSTGMPTKTEQGDLNMVLGASQGDWPRIVLAPRNTAECFYAAARAFNLAEVYQTPVIIISDLYLSEGLRTVDGIDVNVPIVRGFMAGDGKPFLRYKITESGISPRALPGMKGHEFVASTDEHMESGELISDVLAGLPDFVNLRRRMMEKRMRKLQGALRDTEGPELWGSRDAELTLISWGSTQGPLRDAVLELAAEGINVNSLEYCDLFPFHATETEEILKDCKATMCVEGNYTGQFARLLRSETGIGADYRFNKYDGEPFYPREIARKVKEVLAA